MPYIIKSALIDLDAKEAKKIKQSSKNLGNYYSGDRFYTLLNEYINQNLKRKNRFFAFLVNWFFKSGNYKHDPSIANGQSWPVKLFEWWCILCIIGFIAMFVAVIGTSVAGIEEAIKELQGAAGGATGAAISGLTAFGKSFINGLTGNSIMLAFGIIFLVFAVFYIFTYFRYKKPNSKLALKDYVIKKLNFCLKWRWLIKAADKGAKTIKLKKNKELEVFCLNKFEGQGGAGDRWLNIQMINILASIFLDLDLMFKFDSLTDDEYKELKEIMEYDFKRIDIVKI